MSDPASVQLPPLRPGAAHTAGEWSPRPTEMGPAPDGIARATRPGWTVHGPDGPAIGTPAP
jgi:hypothetical protein